MHFYRVFNSMSDKRPCYACTMDEAKSFVQGWVAADRPLLRVELIDVPTDKESICRLLNDSHMMGTTLRTWCGTVRGGVKEIENGA